MTYQEVSNWPLLGPRENWHSFEIIVNSSMVPAGISRNLLIQFEDDQIDETATLATTLNTGSAISLDLDLTVKVLPGKLPSKVPPRTSFPLHQCASFDLLALLPTLPARHSICLRYYPACLLCLDQQDTISFVCLLSACPKNNNQNDCKEYN